MRRMERTINRAYQAASAAYNSGQENVAGAITLGALQLAADSTGVTNLNEAWTRRELFTNRELSDREAVTKYQMGSIQLAGTAATIYSMTSLAGELSAGGGGAAAGEMAAGEGIAARGGMGTARSPVWASAAGDVVVDGASLPGSAGVQIARRLTTGEMEALTQAHGVEFSQVYRTGPGPNGGGGTYRLYSGTINSVDVPIANDIRWISHTHPGGTPFASGMTGDQGVLQALQAAGSPQQSSMIVPVGGQPFRFNVNNTRLP